MNNVIVLISNRLIRLVGNVFKLLSYPFHWLLPKKRFIIPVYSSAKIVPKEKSIVPRKIWQTNFSNQSTLPIYLNYLFNRLMSLKYEYQYVSTEERAEYIKENASDSVYTAYLKLTDGAAQADLWRLVTLYQEGGVYMDIDATLVRPLDRIIPDSEEHIYVYLSKNNEYTNYFLATAPKNPIFLDCINRVVDNINNPDGIKSVYHLTGPFVLTQAIGVLKVPTVERKFVCIQGTFSNEHFQYMDKPRGKWTHKKPEDLVRK